MKRRVLAALVSFGAAACGGESDKPGELPDSGSPVDLDAGPPREANGMRCPEAQKVGEFRLERTQGVLGFSGSLHSGVVRSVKYEVVVEEDDCALIKKTNPFCDPPCSGGSVCTVDDTCEEEPLTVDVGTLRLLGLPEPLTIVPQPPGYNYSYVAETDVQAGASLRLTGSGGKRAVVFFGEGVAGLEVTGDRVTVQRDKPLAFAWKVPAEGKGKIQIALNVDQHGNSPVSLTCDVADDGAHEIPSSIINKLLDSGVSGFPTAFVSRDSVDSVTDASGCAEFLVRHKVQQRVDVVGHTPCMTNANCSEGQHCDLANQT